jgi:predicted  nucleic acid-binding Zn-ribbon protein
MDPDLDRLIRLQQLDSIAEAARRRVADHPALVQALDARLASANGALESAKARVAENLAARRAIEKDLAAIQSRLSKFKDQLMEVKTNKEYTAMLKEIEAAQTEVRRLEDLILERMLEHDELAATQKAAEAQLAADRAAVADERRTLEEETARSERQLEESVSARARVVAEVSAAVLSIYEAVREKRGTAVAEVRGGYCSACHVRIRPQVANELRRNDIIFQCESCKRVLYFPLEGPTPAGSAGPDGVAL